MKTVDLKKKKLSINELLQLANRDALLILAENGQQYILEEADSFEKEVAALSQNEEFMKLLEERAQESPTTPIDALEKKLNQS